MEYIQVWTMYVSYGMYFIYWVITHPLSKMWAQTLANIPQGLTFFQYDYKIFMQQQFKMVIFMVAMTRNVFVEFPHISTCFFE